MLNKLRNDISKLLSECNDEVYYDECTQYAVVNRIYVETNIGEDKAKRIVSDDIIISVDDVNKLITYKRALMKLKKEVIG